MLRLIVSTQDGADRQLQTFDANVPEMEDWLTRLNGAAATLRVEKLEVVAGKARRIKRKEKRTPPMPCPYEGVLAIYHEELVDWMPPQGSKEKPVSLNPVELRKGKAWVKRKELMDELWSFVLLERLPEVHDDGSSRAYTEEEGLAWVRAYFRRARRIDWMMGRRGSSDGWRADFDYLVAERAWQKVIEESQANHS